MKKVERFFNTILGFFLYWKKVDRKTTPWVVVLLHAPWYNTNEAHEGEGESMRVAMECLLFSARVDVVFSGHVHAYERFVSPHLR